MREELDYVQKMFLEFQIESQKDRKTDDKVIQYRRKSEWSWMTTTELSSPSKKCCSKVDSKRHWTNYNKFHFRKWRYRDSGSGIYSYSSSKFRPKTFIPSIKLPVFFKIGHFFTISIRASSYLQGLGLLEW